MNKIGIMLDNIGPNQLAFYTLQQAAKYMEKDPLYDFTVFIQNICRPTIKPMCSIMNISESMSFDGHLIATSFELADKLIKTVNTSKKHFHVWELEWLNNPYLYEKYYAILTNPNLHISTRCAQYANAITKYCGRSVNSITPVFNIQSIISNG